ncbi:MAG: tryptophan 2,3-dioxygenase [Planctomycetes bacterium]|nr:tryptophan 2,3-dioxygenase [Planctomycetota bacterium]
MATSYSEYLALERLLALQGGLTGNERDLAPAELLFIVVHQIDELWFKLALHELERARDIFAQKQVDEQALAPAAAGMRRVVKTFEVAAAHFALMETMSPRDFLDFRTKLGSASGFQSPQFREVEMLFGLADEDRVKFGEQEVMAAFAPKAGIAGWAERKVVARAANRTTLKIAIESWLARTPIDGSTPDQPGDASRVDAFLDAYLACHRHEVNAAMKAQQPGGSIDPQVAALYAAEMEQAELFLRRGDDVKDDPRRRRLRAAALFIESYRELPLLAWPREILDLVIQLEQAFLIFRQRHARMVERMIGRRVGTGGSDGVRYLDETALRYRIFGDLWCARRLLVRQGGAPALANAAFYDFRSA